MGIVECGYESYYCCISLAEKIAFDLSLGLLAMCSLVLSQVSHVEHGFNFMKWALNLIKFVVCYSENVCAAIAPVYTGRSPCTL